MIHPRRRGRCAASLLALLLATGCNSATDTGTWATEPAIIDPAMSSVQLIELPDSAYAGQPVTAVVHTIGLDGCFSAARTDVTVDGLTARIRPYDRSYRGTGACQDILRVLAHETTLTFQQAGTATVIVHGRSMAGEPITHEVELRVIDPGTTF